MWSGGDVCNWLTMLVNRAWPLRRSGLADLPFIEGHNSMSRYLNLRNIGAPHDYCDTSSVYLMCLMELIARLPCERRMRCFVNVYHRLVLGRSDEGHK